MRIFKIVLLVILILLILAFGLMTFLALSGQGQQLQHSLPAFLTPVPAPPSVDSLPAPALQAQTPEDEQLARLYASLWSYRPAADCVSDRESARQDLLVTALDAERFAGSGIREDLIALLRERVSQARHAEEIYDSEGQFDPDLLRSCYEQLLTERTAEAAQYTREVPVSLTYHYAEDGWVLENGEALYPPIPDAASLYAAATAELPYLPLHFTIPEDAVCGPMPREDKFVVTDDPAVIQALLERPEAKALIGEEKLLWNPDLPRIPDTPIRCYLDESILCIVWQEPETQCVGTFSEIFISDGSQLRRKISSDTPWSLWFQRTSTFAKEANAVLAMGGDFYYHGRNCGISVYNREIIRYQPQNADTCFITADGDMLFHYMGDGANQAEVEQFIRDNDIVFSLAFGPVLIDEGVDVTPENYIWGEVDLYYARSALGLLGRHHYLTMNLNAGKGEFDHLPNLRNAADAMVKRGCWKAYTLDGGQTATTVFHGELINPVQFGWEKDISDIIYFATAVPED